MLSAIPVRATESHSALDDAAAVRGYAAIRDDVQWMQIGVSGQAMRAVGGVGL